MQHLEVTDVTSVPEFFRVTVPD